jgi:hypothetical protein
MKKEFSGGAFTFEIDHSSRRVELWRNGKVEQWKTLPLMDAEFPQVMNGPIDKWSSSWFWMLAFEPEQAAEFRTSATSIS